MVNKLIFLCYSVLATCVVCGENVDWKARIRPDHPRLFFNAETWPAIQARLTTSSRAKEEFAQLLRRCDNCPTNPVCSNTGPVTTPPSTPIVHVRDWGLEAAQCAFAWRATRQPIYLEKAKAMLRVSVAAYHEAYTNRRAVHWYSTRRILALCAYDWIYEALTDEERRAIIVPFLQYVEEIQPGPGRPFITRRNGGGVQSGFYSVRSLLWYAGLAAYGDGLCDDLAQKLLEQGRALCEAMVAYRAKTAGDDGGLSSGVPAYCMGAYPWAHFNYFHTWLSATGENLAMRHPDMGLFMNWIWWNRIPSTDPLRPYCFGFGDDQHEQNFLSVGPLYEHTSQYMHFFREADADAARLAATLRAGAPNQNLGGNWFIYSFILPDDQSTLTPFTVDELDARMPHARHFEFLGEFVMRSGWSPDSTYCLFTAGAKTMMHKHWDENNFVIFKHDFLALDSGSRAMETDTSLRYYYSQTVAHNCVLVHRPGEPMPVHWGRTSTEPEAKRGHGGQVEGAARVLAFATNPFFSYVASDAAPVYQGKASAVVRQFLHIQPDFFVVYDRVDSTDPTYRKEWLLHTENEPRIEGRLLQADCGKGRLFCETLLPSDARLAKVGGPGREYWASGKNWELDPKFVQHAENQAKKCGVQTHFGKWRMEVSPAEAKQKETRFLHVLTASDTTRTVSVSTRSVTEGNFDGVELTIPDGVWNEQKGMLKVTCRFARTGEVGGEVRCVFTGASGATEEKVFTLANQIQPQAGVFPKQ